MGFCKGLTDPLNYDIPLSPHPMQITKTIYQPLGSPVTGKASATEIDLGSNSCLSPGTFVSISHDGCCEVDRVITSIDGLVTVSGSYNGLVTVQALADLSGCWLELTTNPLDPISLGIVCATEAGVLLDRRIDPCVVGRSLMVNGTSLGIIYGAAVLADGRSVLSTDKRQKIEGVGVATAGFSTVQKGARVNGSPFATISAQMPSSGSMALYLRQGWQSSKSCVADVISYSELLCSGAIA